MQAVWYNALTLLVVVVVASMMIAILRFDRLRGTALKDQLIKLWSANRRQVLHLEKQNGFYFLIERLIDWSDVTVRLAWLPALSAFAGGTRAVFVAGFLISLCFLIRDGALLYLATAKIAQFTVLLDYDGFGVYARTADNWRALKRSVHIPFVASIIVASLFLAAALVQR